MKIQLEIELSDQLIIDSAKATWSRLFAGPDYNSRNGSEGYAMVAKAIGDYLRLPDTFAEIQAIIREQSMKMLDASVRDCVAEELRKHIKKVIKEEKDGGTLFSKTT